MNVTMFMAMSVNGFIADTNGHENFLSHDGWDVFVELAEKAGVFIIGRKTYEVVAQNFVGFGFKDVKAHRIIVTNDSQFIAADGYIVASSPQSAVDIAKSLGHKDVILTGGSGLNSSFIMEDLIHSIIINVEPAIIGSGIPLFASANFANRLRFETMEHRGSGVLQLRYRLGDKITQ